MTIYYYCSRNAINKCNNNIIIYYCTLIKWEFICEKYSSIITLYIISNFKKRKISLYCLVSIISNIFVIIVVIVIYLFSLFFIYIISIFLIFFILAIITILNNIIVILLFFIHHLLIIIFIGKIFLFLFLNFLF